MSKQDKVQYAKTECPCGMELVFPVKKPSRLTKTVSKVGCKSCDSQFLLHVEVEPKKPIKIDPSRPLSNAERRALSLPYERSYRSYFEVIRVTAEASKRAKNPLNRMKEMIVEKISEGDVLEF